MSNRKSRRRRAKEAKHLRLYDWMLTSPAYLHLTCQARAVLIEIARLYDGANNGRLALSTRVAAQRCRISKDTATRAFAELQSFGFIECVAPGAFSRKIRHAAEWRLTWQRCDVAGNLSTKQFMHWGRQKQNSVLNYSLTVPSIRTDGFFANVGER
jgi:hypothetical protein